MSGPGSKHFRRTKATRLPCHPEGPLLDSGPARVVRPVAEPGLPALETKRKVSQFCLLDIGGLRCLRENRDAVVTGWRFRRVL
jgi:hypothetical protein